MAKKKVTKQQWTLFWDMHSGGGLKEKWPMIVIEAESEEAQSIFYSKFGHNPERVTCTCCGSDYSISSGEDLEQLLAFHMNWDHDKKTNKYVYRSKGYGTLMTLKEYLKSGQVKVIKKDEITPTERTADVPQEGYVWM